MVNRFAVCIAVKGLVQATTMAGLIAQLTPFNSMEIQHSLSQTTMSSLKRCTES